jgi:hypothetical protein
VIQHPFYSPLLQRNSQMGWRTLVSSSVETAKNSAKSGRTASNLSFLWCGGGHLHKECPEKGIPACRNCKLVDGEEPHPSNYRGRRHAKERESRREHQRLQRKGCSLPAPPPQDYPSRQCYAATHSNSSSLGHPQLHRAAPPQREKSVPPSLETQPTTSTKSVS